MDSDSIDSGASNGLLVIDKPAGLTSRDCVNQVVKAVRMRFGHRRDENGKRIPLPKVGHAGTLDPLATGVLVVGVGSGVRMVPYIQQMAKTYEATFRLGVESESGDTDSEVREFLAGRVPAPEDIDDACAALTGEITQTPPTTSAIRIQGRRAYSFAHRGETVVIPPRQVRVDSIRATRYQFPELDLHIQCGSGTYVRTLGMDLAIACGTRAVMTKLQRTAIGVFTIANSVSLDQLSSSGLPELLLPISLAVSYLPELVISGSQLDQFEHGTKISVECANLHEPAESPFIECSEAKVLDTDGQLRALVRQRDGFWCPYRVFPRPQFPE